MSKDKQKWKVCETCKEEIKPIMTTAGKKKMCWYCNCGVFDKGGKKVE